MPRSFNWNWNWTGVGGQGSTSWLRVVALGLGILNLVALYLLFFPPGGSRSALASEGQQLREQISSVRARSRRLRQVSTKVQLGSEQAARFQSKYILPRRIAYERLVVELQRMIKVSGLHERDATFTEEAIEGSSDLTLLTSSANYEGSYENLRRFLVELDHSPVLIMLDTLQASPQQKGNQISASMRFQTILQEEPAPAGAGLGMP